MGGGGVLGMASSFHKTFLSINVHYSLESRLALYTIPFFNRQQNKKKF